MLRFCLLMLCLLLPASAQIEVEVPVTKKADPLSNGYAIVVGVDTYASDKLDELSYAVKDAEAVAKYLGQQGWTVSLMRSSDRNAALRPDQKQDVLREVRFVTKQTKTRDRLLFYFSGHGFLSGQENYLCLSRTKDGQDVDGALSQSEVLEALSAGRAVKKAVILDSCRQAPGGRNLLAGFTRKELAEARGIWHLYAAAPGFKSFEPEAGKKVDGEAIENGFFTHYFLKGVSGHAEHNGDGFVTLVELAMYVEEEMGRASITRKIRRQIPYLLWDGQVSGDFLLGAAQARRVEPASSESPRPRSGEPKHLDTRQVIGAELIYLKPGKFLMGSPESEKNRSSGEHQHDVMLTQGFWMWKTEVIQRQWESVMGTSPWKGQKYVRTGGNYPATWVTWNDAREFCRRLTEAERKAGRVPSGLVYRLPTEAEWEYACRAGSRTAYSFGDSQSLLVDYAWSSENSVRADENYAHQVGGKRPNAWGLLDLHGNVWEWCVDAYDIVEDAGAVTDPYVASGLQRVVRGGCWFFSAQFCRSAYRKRLVPSDANSNLGFRPVLARVLPSH